MPPTAVADQAAAPDSTGGKTLEEKLSSLSIHEPAGLLLAQLGGAESDHSALLPQPSLPPEVLERVVRCLQPGVLIGDPVAHVTLIRLSCVSRLMRYWALETLYSVIILPRHVREFRKWYSRSVKAQPAYQFAGFTRALFSSLDDVSALTSFSAGWDHELLRLLHYCGPSLTHLSLWRAESMALLRDPGQIREGYRYGASQPVQVWGELPNGEADTDADAVEAQDDLNGGDLTAPEAKHADDLFSKEELDDMPGWLKAEIRLQGTRAVTIRHKAHLTPTRRIARRQQGCQPTHLSIMMSLPLLEHEDPKIFSRMLIWHRVQELDVHISTPGHTPKILRLLASLRDSPIRRLRISTTFSSFCMMTPPFPPSKRQRDAAADGGWGKDGHRPAASMFDDIAARSAYIPTLNLCDALTSILHDEVLRRVLVDELQGRPLAAVPHTEQMLVKRCLEGPNRKTSDCSSCPGDGTQSDTDALFKARLEPQADAQRQAALSRNFRLTITRGNQAIWAKLKDRLWDFRQRVEGISEGSWEVLS